MTSNSTSTYVAGMFIAMFAFVLGALFAYALITGNVGSPF